MGVRTSKFLELFLNVLSLLRRGFLASVLSLTVTAAAAQTYSPILTETEGKGPKERVVRFKVNPLAESYPLDRQVSLVAPVQAAIEAGEDHALELGRTLEDQAFRQGLSIFSIGTGIGGAVATVLEQGYVDELFPASLATRVFPKLSSGLTNLGLALTMYQIALGPTSGDDRPAILNAYKGVTSYLLSRFGTPGVQLAMIAALPIDISLSYFGDAAWSAREDAWRQSYQKYYKEMDESAKAAYFGSVGRFPPTLEERVAEIRARKEGGRTINEWKILLVWYLDNINRPEKFKQVLEVEVRNYVTLFWDSARFSEYAADVDQATAGYARGTSLTRETKKKLEDEHYSTIMAKLIRDVLPEIALDRFIKGLADQAGKLNREVRPELNAPLKIELSAFGLESPTKFHLLLENGDTWKGTLTPGEPLRVQLTKLAWFKAGFPDTIRLDAAGGAVERRFVFEQDEALVVFGTPEADGMIVSYRREEGPQDCTITARGGGRPERTTTEQRAARPDAPLQTATTTEGYVLIGRFDGTTWSEAAPGRILGGRRDFDGAGLSLGQGDLVFAAPYFEWITGLSACRADETELLTDALLPDFTCRVHRQHREKTAQGRETVTRCSAEMHLQMDGVWAEVDGKRQYVPLEREQFDTFGREYQNMLERLPGAGLK